MKRRRAGVVSHRIAECRTHPLCELGHTIVPVWELPARRITGWFCPECNEHLDHDQIICPTQPSRKEAVAEKLYSVWIYPTDKPKDVPVCTHQHRTLSQVIIDAVLELGTRTDHIEIIYMKGATLTDIESQED